jgi:hypothetical protein
MSGKNFSKLFKDSGLMSSRLTTTDLDIIFAKVRRLALKGVLLLEHVLEAPMMPHLHVVCVFSWQEQ